MCVYVCVFHIHMYITQVSYTPIPSHHMKLNAHSIKCKQNVFFYFWLCDATDRKMSRDVSGRKVGRTL